MVLSMTGCGQGAATDGPNACRVELRTVNNRSFKLALRAREGLGRLEPQIEAEIRRRIRRGTVQMAVEVNGPLAPGVRRLDRQQISAYLDDLEDVCAARGLPGPQSLDALLGLSGAIVEAPAGAESAADAWPLVARALDAALDALDAMRRSEGEALAADMLSTIGEIRGLAAGIRDRVPAAVEEHRGRLHDRVRRLLESHGSALAPGDLAREVALIADRSDVAEELVRLESHLRQFEQMLAEDASGRSLDFLTQELAREANTIASKSADVAIAHAVVEVKTRVERLREQVQNIE